MGMENIVLDVDQDNCITQFQTGGDRSYRWEYTGGNTNYLRMNTSSGTSLSYVYHMRLDNNIYEYAKIDNTIYIVNLYYNITDSKYYKHFPISYGSNLTNVTSTVQDWLNYIKSIKFSSYNNKDWSLDIFSDITSVKMCSVFYTSRSTTYYDYMSASKTTYRYFDNYVPTKLGMIVPAQSYKLYINGVRTDSWNGKKISKIHYLGEDYSIASIEE